MLLLIVMCWPDLWRWKTTVDEITPLPFPPTCAQLQLNVPFTDRLLITPGAPPYTTYNYYNFNYTGGTGFKV